MRLSELFPRDEIRNLSPSDWRSRMMLDKSAEVRDMRGCVGRLVNFAEKLGILDAEMLARLKSEDYDQFRSAVFELSVCEFLSAIGEIEWNPSARDSRVGEFRVIPSNHQPIFVEVKSIFVSPDERRQHNNWRVLREIAHGTLSPFRISVEFLELQQDVVPRRFRAWLHRHIASLGEELSQPGQERELVFSDTVRDGTITKVKVMFIRMQGDDHATTCDMSSGLREGNVHERVIGIVDRALEQLPDDQPTLVVITSTEWIGLDEFEMLASMFSCPKVTFALGAARTSGEETTIHYGLEGIVQQSIRTRLSAVGVWHHRWTPDPQGALDVYHNPLAARNISHQVLQLPNVRQLVPTGEGTMEWTPNRPVE